MSVKFASRLVLRAAAIAAAAGAATIATTVSGPPYPQRKGEIPEMSHNVPSRSAQLSLLANTSPASPFDLLVIGGGATGAGVALDASTRGMKVAMVERDDFGSGTSSRSTKLIHGGVRYLEKAVFNLDSGQLNLVIHALRERSVLIRNAPHLTSQLPTLTPCYNWQDLPYYWSGLKVYDLLAGRSLLQVSQYCSAARALQMFPTLSPSLPDGRKLKGGVIYVDGQMDDARLNVALATTAARAGGVVLNHAEVVGFRKDKITGKIVGARVKDTLTGQFVDVYAKSVINASGPFCDGVRKMADSSADAMILPSGGSHVVLPDFYSSLGVGLIVPRTDDGRVVFLLPWQGRTLAGTTDSRVEVSENPRPKEEEIGFILDAIQKYLAINVKREDILSVWSGIRPLAKDPTALDTSSVSRDHIVTVGESGLISVMGGKWTTYRSMAQDAVDVAVKVGNFTEASPCVTEHVPLTGAELFEPTLFAKLTQFYIGRKGASSGKVEYSPIETAVAKHLSNAYGDRAMEVVTIAQKEGLGARLTPRFPVLEAEVVYCARNEYSECAIDFLARRSRIVFLDANAAMEALPKVVDLMAAEHKWSWSRKRAEFSRATAFIEDFKDVQQSKSQKKVM